MAMAKLRAKVSAEKFARYSANTPEIADGVGEEIQGMVSSAFTNKARPETRPDWLFLFDA
jgi:hypothetical protein